MTRMLASVTGPDEAEIALAGGADIIDLKDPTKGALGAVPAACIRSTVARVGGRRPVSAVAGEYPMQPDAVLAAAEAVVDAGPEFVKLGIFPGGVPESCFAAVAGLARRVKLIAVLFADLEPDLELLPGLGQAGFRGAMLDTARKD